MELSATIPCTRIDVRCNAVRSGWFSVNRFGSISALHRLIVDGWNLHHLLQQNVDSVGSRFLLLVLHSMEHKGSLHCEQCFDVMLQHMQQNSRHEIVEILATNVSASSKEKGNS